MRVLILPHPAAVDHRQYVFVEQALTIPVAVKPAVGRKAFAALIEPQLLARPDQLLAVHILGLIGRCQPKPDRELVLDIPLDMQGVTLWNVLHPNESSATQGGMLSLKHSCESTKPLLLAEPCDRH